MNLYLSERSFANTVLMDSEHHGRAIYHVDTPMKFFGTAVTTIKNIPQGNSCTAEIKPGGWSGSSVRVHGRDLHPAKGGFFSNSESFVASDGREYKWKAHGNSQSITLETNHQPVAFYDRGSRGIFGKKRKPCLNLTPQAMSVMDEIVATWIYMELKAQRRRNAASSSAAAGASAGASASAASC